MALGFTKILPALAFLGLSGYCTEIRGNSCRRNGLFELTASGFRLEAAVTAAKRTERLFSCSHFCLAVSSCRSFNYNPLENLCEILSHTQQDVGADKLKFGSGWQYYSALEKLVSIHTYMHRNIQ